MPLLGNDSDVIGNYQLYGQQLKKSLEYMSTVVVQLNSQVSQLNACLGSLMGCFL